MLDEVVWSFLHAFLGHQFFFVELFARAETSVGNFDVYIRCVAGKLDQVSGKGVDLYRGAHVQDEDLAAFGVGSCLEDKAYGLRDGHKVTDDVRMCDSDRTAFFNLALEQRDHASVAAENVFRIVQLRILCRFLLLMQVSHLHMPGLRLS